MNRKQANVMTWVRQTVTTVAAIGLALWLPAPALADTATSTAGPALATPGLAIVPTSPSFRGGAAVSVGGDPDEPITVDLRAG